MKFKPLLVVSALALSVASTAHAADIIVPNIVPVAPAFSWAGFYAGAQLGYGWYKDKNESGYGLVVLNPDFDPNETPASTTPIIQKNVTVNHNLNSNGIMGGLYAGYNSYVADSVIVGVETDFAWNNNSHKDFNQNYDKYGVATDTDEEQGIQYTYHDKSKVKWNGATRVRIGYGVDRVLPYVAAGVAYAGVKTDTSLTETGLADPRIEHSKNSAMIGWTIGAGVDYAVRDDVILRLEYRYNDYGKKDIDKSVYENLHQVTLMDKKTLSSNDLRIGVAYKF